MQKIKPQRGLFPKSVRSPQDIVGIIRETCEPCNHRMPLILPGPIVANTKADLKDLNRDHIGRSLGAESGALAFLFRTIRHQYPKGDTPVHIRSVFEYRNVTRN
jgi:hypothetical protein